MKKSLLLIMISIVSFLGIKDVKADTYVASDFYSGFDRSIGYYNTYKENINHLIEMWEESHSQDYPYYFITEVYSQSELSFYVLFSANTTDFRMLSNGFISSSSIFSYAYSIKDNEYIYSSLPSFIYGFALNGNSYIVDSNFNPTFKYMRFITDDETIDFDVIRFPSFTSSTTSFSINELDVKNGNYFPTLTSLYDGSYEYNFLSVYEEIDLNNFSYVALSLKDYDVDPFDTVMYVKGQLCPSGVYNYGMTSKEDFKNGYQVTDRCNIPYDNFTPTKFYILDGDLKNHAIWYLKAYDTSIENKIKVDTNIFNIHYITEEEKDNPILNINGKNYTTIPYDELPSTATKNESENFVPGASEETSFSDIFTKPLEFLKSIWNSIVSVFGLITSFITLLPIELQSLLYTGFALALALGLLKILL